MVDRKDNKTHEPDIMYESDSGSGNANIPLLARQSILLLVLLSVAKFGPLQTCGDKLNF